MRRATLRCRAWIAIVGALTLPSRALAGWGDENWGEMLWGLPASVPSLPGIGLIALAFALAATAAWTLRKRCPALGLPVLLLLLAIPLVVAAETLTVPNTFTNGTTAEADEVNANFAAVETAINDNDSRITEAQSTADAAVAGHTVNTNTQLDEDQVDAFVADNGFGLATDVSANTAAIAALGAATGLEACLDGLTVADHDTGLLWEKKTGTPVAYPGVNCESAGCPDPHNVANAYEWSNTSLTPDGNVFTDFLAKLNDPSQPATWSSSSPSSIGTQTSGCFADHCDWRLPNVVEIQTILDCGFGIPCIDPLFGATASSAYWSGSSDATNPVGAWGAGFGGGNVIPLFKASNGFVRAVRAGSCGS